VGGNEAAKSTLVVLVEDVCKTTEEDRMFLPDAFARHGAEIKG
jgi:hypothetical protein